MVHQWVLGKIIHTWTIPKAYGIPYCTKHHCVLGNIKLVQFETKNYLELKPKLNLGVKTFLSYLLDHNTNNPHCASSTENHKSVEGGH